MKKTFTFFSLFLVLVLGVKAQTTTWDFTASNPTWPAGGMGTDPVELIDSKGLGLHNGTTNVNFGAWQGGQSASSWSAPNDVYTAATVRVQTNGGGYSTTTGVETTPTQRYFFIQVDQACTVKVWFKSGSSTASRNVIASDGTTLYGKAASVTSVTAGFPTSGGFLNASITKAGTFYLYGDAAVNIYQIQVVGATVSLTPTNTLPVKFASISAINTNGINKITWTSESEVNTQNYVIERSADGINFTQVGMLAANGSTKYVWMDNAPLNGKAFYRVKGIDKAGTANYSAIVKTGASLKAQELTIAPNPVRNGQLNLQMANFSKGQYTVNIYNNASQKVFTKTLANDGGTTSQLVQLPATLKNGVYNLQLLGDAVKMTKRLVVE